MKTEIRFGAPWSSTVTVLTLVVIALLLTVSIVSCFTMPDTAPLVARLIAIVAPVAILLCTLPFLVRGYALTERDLLIERLGWQNRIALNEVVSATIDPDAMRWSLRLCGCGGLFGFFGWFRNRKLGVYRAYCTDLKRCVIVKLKTRTIVITPDDPVKFVTEINSHCAGSLPLS
jgi:Bacterial PH domain